jgi:hypothetical protein
MILSLIRRQKARLTAYKTNAAGIKLPGRYLIIESDDWGAIRTPSKEALKLFEKRGLGLGNSIYKNDSLASNEDLDQLFNLLQSFKDSKGNALKITANAIMANPNFEKIKAAGFTQFYFEDFRITLQKYPEHDKAFLKWKQAIADNIFVPQFHGREHLQYKRWLKVLQSGNEDALFCFNSGATYSGKNDYSFMEAYDWDQPEDVNEQKKIVEEGLNMFENVFGFISKSFIAPCYNWDPKLEPMLASKGVQLIQGIRNQLIPTGIFDQYERLPHYFGEVNSAGLKYNIRNCFLEPSQLPGKDWVDSCLAQVQSAFLLKKPAVVCSHRINYIGFINQHNRDRGLKDLQRLIKMVLKKWPDVTFISTDQLNDLLPSTS